MCSNRPRTVEELFEFYYKRFKPIYTHVESLNRPPIEMFFEVNAAFDHLSRKWHYGEPDEEVIEKVCAHLKRGCFDAFKLFVKEASDQYVKLSKVDTSIIDNGEFDRNMIRLITEIREGAATARLAEGDTRSPEKWHYAFDLWEPVYARCVEFQEKCVLNPKVEWARKKTRKKTIRDMSIGLVVGVLASLLAAVIYDSGKSSLPSNHSNPSKATVTQPASSRAS